MEHLQLGLHSAKIFFPTSIFLSHCQFFFLLEIALLGTTTGQGHLLPLLFSDLGFFVIFNSVQSLSTPGLSVHHQLPESTQTHVH